MGVPVSQAEAVTNPGGTGTTITPTISSHQEDDVLIIQVGWKGNQAPTSLSGWTHWFTNTTGTATTGVGQGVWWRRVNPSETVTSPTLTIGTTAVERIAICYTIRGADIDNPADTFWLRQQTVGNSATPTPPSITTSAPNYLLLHLVSCRGNSAITPPTGYNEEQDAAVGTTVAVEGSTKTQATAATVSGQAASITSGRWVAAIVAIPSPDYPYFRAQTNATATATSVTGTLPTGTTAIDFYGRKDLIIATVEAAGTAPSPNTGADWTSIATWETTTSGGATTVRQYWALYDGSIDLQFNRSGSGEISLNLSTYRNAHQTTPIGAVNVRQNASSTTSTWDALTRTYSKSTVVAMCVADGTPSYTAPAGWTEREDGLGMTGADQIFEAAGSTASASFTLSAASPTAVGLVEIISQAGVAGSVDLPLTLSDNAANLADALAKTGGQLKTFTETINLLADAMARQMEHRVTFSDSVASLTDGEVHVLGIAITTADSLQALTDAQVQLLGYLLALADTQAATWADAHQLLLAQFLALSDITGTAVVARDTFTTGANSNLEDHTTDNGLAWAPSTFTAGGVLFIDAANDFITKTATAEAAPYQVSVATSADCYVQANITMLTSINVNMGLMLRVRTDGSDNYYFVRHNQADSLWTIRRSLGGTAIAIGTSYSDPMTATDTRLVRFEAIGDQLALYIDGVLRATATDSSHPAGGYTGIRGAGAMSTTTGYAVDNFESGSLGGLFDSLTHTLGFTLTLSDSINNLADAYAQQLQVVSGGLELNLSDSISLSDSLALGYGLLAGDTIALTDAQTTNLGYLIPFSDTLILTDFTLLNQDQLLGFNDSFILVDSESNILGFNQPLSDSISLTDAESNQLGHLLQFSDSISLTDTRALLLSHLLNLADTLTLTDAALLILHHLLPLDDDINTFTDLLVTDTPQGPSILVGVADSLPALSDSAQLQLGHHLTLADNAANWADSLAKTLGLTIILADNAAVLTDAQTALMHHLLQVADQLALLDTLATFGTNALVVSDSFLLTDSVEVELRGPDFNIALVDTLVFIDAIELGLNDELQLGLSLVDTITISDHYFDLRHPYLSSPRRHVVVSSAARLSTVDANRVSVVPAGNRSRTP